MRFIVLIKQVPSEVSPEMNADFTVNRGRVRKITNPADVYALSLALDGKKKMGGEVTCITMGPSSAVSSLQEAALQGADQLIHVCDPLIAGADTLVTARILAEAVRYAGGADVVFCGNSSVDGETGQVGAELAVLLDLNCIRNVTDVDSMGPDSLECRCFSDEESGLYRVGLPAVLCVCPKRNPVILPTRAALRRAEHMPVHTLTLADLGLQEISGKASSCTKVIHAGKREHGRRKTRFLSGQDMTELFGIIRQGMADDGRREEK